MKRDRSEVGLPIEAVAKCLMLLSKVGQNGDLEGHRDFACKTCNKRFSSFQALGGHRASHKRPKLAAEGAELSDSGSPKKTKAHECSICGLEFSIGQALGGHMRRHRGAASEAPVTKELLPSNDIGGLCLDLSLALPSIDCLV